MPTQDEVIDLLSRLYRSDLLQTSALLDFSDLYTRSVQGKRRWWLNHLASPLSLRFPLFDPDRFLARTLPWVRPLLGWPALVVWLCVVLSAMVLAVTHWSELSGEFSDSLLSMENLLAISLIYPMLKVLHEFGHAYMVRKEGGEVHEMGVMLLVFMPIPYVDASASSAFRNKYQRMAVGGAGILVELLVAALMLFVWLNVEEGAVRALAYRTMLVAGAATFLFNGNPLLRFDAYYVLADFLEIPNLAQRSVGYLGYLFKRYLFALDEVESPAGSAGEAVWLFLYAIASFCYRILISFKTILFIAGRFFFVGIVLAAWAVGMMILLPVGRVGMHLLKDGHMKRKRARILATLGLPLIVLLLGLILVPVPLYTTCEGVVWVSEESRVFASASGFVDQVLVTSGTPVRLGEPLVHSTDEFLTAQIRALQARLEEFEARHQQSMQKDRAEAQMIEEEIGSIRTELAHAHQRQADLVVHSPSAGRFVLPDAEDLPGRFVQRGEPLGYIVDPARTRVRVMVTQEDIDRVRTDTKRVEVRCAENIDHVVAATVAREVPAASQILPSLAFSLEGGGQFALDPRERDHPQVLERLFQFDLNLAEPLPGHVEERVFVRFEHSAEPLAWRLYRMARRLLLSRFAV